MYFRLDAFIEFDGPTVFNEYISEFWGSFIVLTIFNSGETSNLLEPSCAFCNRNGDCIIGQDSQIYCDCHPPFEGEKMQTYLLLSCILLHAYYFKIYHFLQACFLSQISYGLNIVHETVSFKEEKLNYLFCI